MAVGMTFIEVSTIGEGSTGQQLSIPSISQSIRIQANGIASRAIAVRVGGESGVRSRRSLALHSMQGGEVRLFQRIGWRSPIRLEGFYRGEFDKIKS
jgi:hypothetical protein